MDKIKFRVMIVFLFLSAYAFGQKNVVKAGFSDAFLGNFNLNYERALTQQQSL